jgi:hypothetical protein
MLSNLSLHALTAEDALASLRALRRRQPVTYSAFYSSQLGGVVTDPALMVIPFDDHMVHRGHGIFDTAGLVNGRIYDLEAHLDRFVGSAERSRLGLFSSREEMRDIIIKTTAVSGYSLLVVVRTGQPRTHAGGRRAAGVFRHGLFRTAVSGAVVHGRPASHDHDVPHQATALRNHQGHQLSAQRPHANGSEGRRLRQRRLHR